MDHFYGEFEYFLRQHTHFMENISQYILQNHVMYFHNEICIFNTISWQFLSYFGIGGYVQTHFVHFTDG